MDTYDDSQKLRQDAVRAALREKQSVAEDEADHPKYPSVPLKRGAGEMDMGWVRSWETILRRLSEQQPEQFQALVAMHEGRTDVVSKDMRKELRKCGYLGRRLSVLPSVSAVLSASLRKTEDGLCVVDPVDINIDNLKVIVSTEALITQQKQNAMNKLRNQLFNNPQDDELHR